MASKTPTYSSIDYPAHFDNLKEDEPCDNCLFRLVNIEDDYLNQVILGPCLCRQFQISLSLQGCFPQFREEKLPLQKSSIIINVWLSREISIEYQYDIIHRKSQKKTKQARKALKQTKNPCALIWPLLTCFCTHQHR